MALQSWLRRIPNEFGPRSMVLQSGLRRIPNWGLCEWFYRVGFCRNSRLGPVLGEQRIYFEQYPDLFSKVLPCVETSLMGHMGRSISGALKQIPNR